MAADFAGTDEILPGQPAYDFGILYAEDFDDPAEPDPVQPEAEAYHSPPPITSADVEAACVDAVRAARIEWQAGLEQARNDALARLGTSLVGLEESAERVALAAAEGTAATILAMVSALLPQFGRSHGPGEIRALLARLLPTIRSNARIVVRVNADLVGPIERDLATADLSTTVGVVAAPLEPGDVRVSWENGAAARDTRQIMQAVQDALGQLGLHQPIETPAKRSLAYAD